MTPKPLANFSAKANKLQKDPLSTDIKKEEEPFYHHEKKRGQVCMSVRTICVTITQWSPFKF